MANTKIPAELSSTPSISDSGDATAITIDSSENVGTAAKLSVGTTTVGGGNTKIVATGGTDNYLQLVSNTGSGGISLGNAGANLLIYTHTGALGSESLAERMRIDSSGNVGIGTSSPSKVLTISGDDAEFLLNRTGTYADTINMGMPGGIPTIAGGTHLAFGGNGTWNEHMRITSDGKVGIGKTDPNYPLVVAGTNPKIQIYDSDGNGQTNLYFGDSGSNLAGYVIYQHSDDKMRIGTSATDRITIDASGRYGFSGTYPATSAQFMRIEEEFASNRIMRIANRDNSGNSNTVEIGHADNNEGAHILLCYHGNNTSGASGDPFLDVVLSLQVNGNLAIDGSFSPNSDRRLKKDITNCTYGLDAINQLIPRTYKGRDVSKEMMGTQIGLIADEVEGIIPEVVSKFGLKADGSTLSKTIVGYGDEEGTEETFDQVKNISYERLVVVLTKALQEADTKIEDLKARIETLEG